MTAQRRKRINRIKTAIIIIAIIFLLLPSILCILLGIQVFKLQGQVDDLISYHQTTEQMTKSTKTKKAYAYAAEKSVHQDNDTQVSETLLEAGITIIGLNEDSQDDLDTLQRDHTISDVNINNEKNNENAENIKNTENNKIIENIIDNNENLDITSNGEIGPISADNIDVNGIDVDTINNDTIVHRDNKENKADEMNGIENRDIYQQNKSEIKTENGIYKGKKVYLTFDDGPSKYTDEILDILAEYDAKATFFVLGKTDRNSKQIYKRIVAEGHTLGMHSYSHVYSKIYKSIEDFDKDFTKLWKLLYDTTGYKPAIYRFPGGSSNLVNKNGMDEFIRYLNDKSVPYYDWNVDNGDATGVEYTKEQLIDNVLNGVALKKRSIVLMHDSETKKVTVESLSGILEALLSEGAEVLPLDESVPPIQQIKASSIE